MRVEKPYKISTKMMELKALKLTDEELFIVLCCRNAVKRSPTDALDILVNQGLDWTFIEGIIRQQGIAGIVNSALAQSRYLHNTSDEVLKNLTLAVRQTAFKNLVYLREFSSLVKACNSEHIRIVPLKGIAFLTSLYKHNTTLRSLSDIDILVEKKDVERVNTILLTMGYQPKQTSDRDRQRAFDAIYRRRVSGFTILIEVHWDIDYTDSSYAIDIAECWTRSHTVTADLGTYYELSCEDTLILNCFHILRYIPKGPEVLLHLKNFCDIAALITQSNDDINWECVIQRSRHYKVLRPVGLVLCLVRNLLGITQVPSAIFEALREESFQEVFAVCAVREYIFNTAYSEKKRLPFWMVDLATASSVHEKIKILKGAPNIFLSLYRARYFERYGRSTPKALIHITWYYTRKAGAAIALWILAPRKTAQLQNKMTSVNRKTQEVIDWLQH